MQLLSLGRYLLCKADATEAISGSVLGVRQVSL